MRSFQIEGWALRVMDCVEANQPSEDSRVELKSDWPEPRKAARQIAAHANAARGEPILWLIGVDQKAGLVKGAQPEELANWYPAIQAEFDELAPRVTDVNVPWKGLTVVALLFETDRFPFVVKNPAYGTATACPVSLEVPWRGQTSIRSAHRSDLIRLLSPVQMVPSLEVLAANLAVIPHPDEKVPTGQVWTLNMDLYAAPKSEARVVIPSHKCKASFEFEGHGLSTPLGSLAFGPQDAMSLTKGTATEAIIIGPGRIRLSASAKTPYRGLARGSEPNIRVAIDLLPIEGESPVSLSVALHPLKQPSAPILLAEWGFSALEEQ